MAKRLTAKTVALPVLYGEEGAPGLPGAVEGHPLAVIAAVRYLFLSNSHTILPLRHPPRFGTIPCPIQASPVAGRAMQHAPS